ncbi:MAG: AMP-binding protein [Desulfovibrionales bacterium]|nr:AMP-binding protein [Desulfovibrionales bacterium]
MSVKQDPFHALIATCPAREYKDLQYGSTDEIHRVQTQLLKSHLAYALEHSPLYGKRARGITPEDITTLEDIGHLPLTRKGDMDRTQDLQAVPAQEIADICLTSGTTSGIPTLIPLTQGDISRLAYNEEIALAMSGVTDKDTVLVCAALDRCFMAGMAYFLGGTQLGASMVRGGAGSAAQHWELIKLTRPTVIVGVPSLMHKIAHCALENGESPAATSVNRLIAIGEPTRDARLERLPMAKELEDLWQAKIFSTYASSEMATTFCECEARQGGHLRPELMVLEILDENNRPLAPGEKGEVVVTPLGVKGMPLIRFKTGDISYLITEPCDCGRTTPRLAPVIGRKNQMLKYKGTTLFPNALLSALEGDPRFHGGYVEARTNPDGTDRVILHAASAQRDSKMDWIHDILQAKIRVVPEIRILTPEAADAKVYQFHKKRKRITFFDHRNPSN